MRRDCPRGRRAQQRARVEGGISSSRHELRPAGLRDRALEAGASFVALHGHRGVFSQSDKGELVVGGALDRLPSYAQRGIARFRAGSRGSWSSSRASAA